MAALKLLWSVHAQRDVERLREFLAVKSPAAAERAAARILDVALRAARYPPSGRPLEEPPGARELVASFGSGAYILRYAVLPGAVLVLRVWHSRELRK